MATSFFYIYVMATSFFYIYIDINIDIYVQIDGASSRSIERHFFVWVPPATIFILKYTAEEIVVRPISYQTIICH